MKRRYEAHALLVDSISDRPTMLFEEYIIL